MPVPFPSPTSVPSVKCAYWRIGVLLGLERKQVSVLALSFRESPRGRVRVPCIHPAQVMGVHSARRQGTDACRRGVHWCYNMLLVHCYWWLRIHSTLRPLSTTNDNAKLKAAAVTTKFARATSPPAFVAPHPCPPPLFQPALRPRLQIPVPVTVGSPPPPPPPQAQAGRSKLLPRPRVRMHDSIWDCWGMCPWAFEGKGQPARQSD